MSMAGAAAAAGGNGQGGEGAGEAENKAGTGAAGAGDGGDGGGEGGKQQLNTTGDDSFDINAIGDDLKNPDVYKDGKYFGKYKSLGEAAKGLKELAGKMVNREGKAPEKYDFKDLKIEGHDGLTVDENDPVAKAALPVLKKFGLNQAEANELAAAVLPALAAPKIDEKAEMEALGKDAQAILANVGETIAGAPKEISEALGRLDFSADLTKVLNWAFEGKVEQKIPTKLPGAEGKTSAQLQDEAFAYKNKHAKTIEGDETQQKEYQRLMTLAMQAGEMEEKAKK